MSDTNLLVIIAFFQGIVVVLLGMGLKECISLAKALSSLNTWVIQHEKNDDERHTFILDQLKYLTNIRKNPRD